jgi:Permuted papain-like amidase enzyme, YaeF/YiiX, C92 family
MTRPTAFGACLLGCLAACGAKTLPAVRDGDIIFHTSRSSQSEAVQRATGSRYSHMGLIVHRQGAPYVLEAVATVRYTPLAAWISRGNGHHFVVKRLKDARLVLTPKAIAALSASGQLMQGRRYDLTFGWSDDRIYCSELVWKIYDRALGIHIGALQRLRDFNLTDPVVRAKMQERYGAAIPLDEPVISPGAMFSSPLLETVAQE